LRTGKERPQAWRGRARGEGGAACKAGCREGGGGWGGNGEGAVGGKGGEKDGGGAPPATTVKGDDEVTTVVGVVEWGWGDRFRSDEDSMGGGVMMARLPNTGPMPAAAAAAPLLLYCSASSPCFGTAAARDACRTGGGGGGGVAKWSARSSLASVAGGTVGGERRGPVQEYDMAAPAGPPDEKEKPPAAMVANEEPGRTGRGHTMVMDRRGERATTGEVEAAGEIAGLRGEAGASESGGGGVPGGFEPAPLVAGGVVGPSR